MSKPKQKADAPKRKPGTPHPDKEQKIETVLGLMSTGGAQSCYKACQAAGVAIGTFYEWVNADALLAERYAQARNSLIEHIAAEAMAIADEPAALLPTGAIDSAAVQKQRLQIDTRKWLLSKLAPKKYGDKIEVSGDAENPLAIKTIERVVVKHGES
jgi:hypothetical protein